MGETKLQIETGHAMTGDVAKIDATRVRFVAQDGRTMFEVSAGLDGKSIEVRGVETTRVGGVLHSERLAICPTVSNHIVIRACLYDEY